MKSKAKDFFKTWSGCLLWLAVALLLFKGCRWYSSYQKEKKHKIYIEKQKNDSIRKAFVVDSLAHDPHYQDSIRLAEIIWKARRDSIKAVRENLIAGVILEGDSIYHSCFHDPISINDADRLRFVTNKDVKMNNYRWCSTCRDLDVDILLEDGEIIYIEDALDHDLIPIEKAGDYCDRPHWDDY